MLISMPDDPGAPRTPLRLFLATLIAVLLMFLVGQAILGALIVSSGVDLLNVGEVALTSGQRQALRLGLFLNNLLLFTVGATLGLWYVFRDGWASSVDLTRPPRPYSLGYAVGIFVVSLPVVSYAAYVNLQLDLPDWAMRSEAQTDALLVQILNMDSIPALILTLLTVGVTAGLGEELLLRGVLQRQILGRWLRNHHAAIWLAAAVFSAMHIEFAGFVPRLLLGVSLGYAYYWSRSLWVPIVLHFLFNSLQVVVAYSAGEFDPTVVSDDVPPWWMAAGCLLLCVVLAVAAERKLGPATPISDDTTG